MCIQFSEPQVTETDLTIYKCAPDGKSEYVPPMRSQIPGYSDLGKQLQYPVGENVASPSGPGIMGYVERKRFMWGYSWLELRVPAGASIRTGVHEGYPVVAASKVFVVRQLLDDDPRFL